MSGAQGVVERASAQLTKRINGLRRGKGGSGGGGGGVVERVTTALCGTVLPPPPPPEKPARCRSKPPVPPPRRTAILSAARRPSKVDELLLDDYFLNFLFRFAQFHLNLTPSNGNISTVNSKLPTIKYAVVSDLGRLKKQH